MNSMTGFGRASSRDRKFDIDVELRSVNHRFLSLKQSLPEELGRCEPEVEQMVRGTVVRGSVSLTVTVKSADSGRPRLPDLDALREVVTRLREVRKELKLKRDVELEDLLAVPTLWGSSNLEAPAEELWPRVKKLLAEALKALSAARAREGKAVEKDLRARLAAIEGRVEKVRERGPSIIEAYQKRLDERIQSLLRQKGLEVAKVDIVREVAIHADRCDVSEELQRLTAHIAEFRKILAGDGQVGRRLDFLTQEMGRETNTIASKGNDAAISACAVDMKAELEKIKEQVDNVE
jgi:uncharacterized protein (TIGR00255 family)